MRYCLKPDNLSRKKIIITLLIIVGVGPFAITSLGQYDQNNLRKYWFYRNRLVNYFTSVGPNPGQSMVFSNRNYSESPSNTSSIISGGENTINLGLYIGVLATEYKLLNDNGQDVSNTARELYYAMYAFNRLDAVSETYYPDPDGGNPLNGFFIRRDIHVNYIVEYPAINKGLPNPTPPENYHGGSGQPMWIDSVRESIEEDIDKKGIPDPMSQDNAYGIILGMALVAKCVPSSANYNGLAFQDGQTQFVNEARAITHRLVMWIKKHPDWIIRTPAGDFVGGGGGANNPDKFNNNGMSFLFAFGVAMAASQIDPVHSADYFDDMTYHDYPIWQALQVIGNAVNICDRLNEVITPITFPLIGTYTVPIFVTDGLNNCARAYNLRMVLDLAAIGNSWFANIVPQPTGMTEIQQMLQLNNPLSNTTQLSILALAEYYNWSSYFSLLRQVLHGGVYLYQHLNTEAQLNNAPCDGTFCHSPTDKAPNSWAAERRFSSDLNEQNNGPSFDFGNFHGLDFMLLHNLYYIVAGDKDSENNLLPQYQSLMDITVHFNFPLPFPNIGSMTTPFTVGSFGTITADNTIKAVSGSSSQTGNVTYKAGKSIHLKPGFKVEKGAYFHGYIDPFTCSGNVYSRTANDSSGTKDKGNTGEENEELYGIQSLPFKPNKYAPMVPAYEDMAQEESLTQAKINSETSKKALAEEIGSIKESKIVLTPNPTGNGVFMIQISQFKINSSDITVYNVLGETIYKSVIVPLNSQTYIDISTHPRGIYFVKIQDGEEVEVQKIVFQ